eukprot:maker-scaffold_8-snap-gene-5.10-mRNA-1 protein AED:0.02 eAED:0.02 QI:105/1/1/1/1/1/4/312/553
MLKKAISKFSSVASAHSPSKRLAVLCILDGWGFRPFQEDNSVLQAKTPNYDSLFSFCSQRKQINYLNASEEHVGLPKGQIGNSEVGHMNIGAGRVILQDLLRINSAVNPNSSSQDKLAENPELKNFLEKVKKANRKIHLMGLLSPGGVHAMQHHIAALANECAKNEVKVVLHGFTDGRDVPPKDTLSDHSLPEFLRSIEGGLDSGMIKFGSISGRYYAMDRDNRWERVHQAYDVIVNGENSDAKVYASAKDIVEKSYEDNKTDEFIIPAVVKGYEGIKQGDGLIMANFRADRAREILKALLFPEEIQHDEVSFDGVGNKLSAKLGMVKYSDDHDKYMTTLFAEKDIRLPLGEVVANKGLKQLRIAETEKYPHVTFFFNGGRETPFENEDRILVPSPKVATYDLQPEMSAPEVSEKLVKAIGTGEYNLVVINYANPDMVGHTGDINAAIKACEAVDEGLGKLLKVVEEQNGSIIVTADHGNCEQMWNYEIDEPHTAHTLNKVPCMIRDFSGSLGSYEVNDGALCDLAPSLLECLGVEQPEEMTGTSLIRSTDLS